MKRVFVAAMLAAAVGSTVAAGSAQASVVVFSGAPATSFADGSFSHNLSGDFADGFYQFGSPTTAVNGYGQDHESIWFSSAVRLNSLVIGQCGACFDTHPATFTVNLFSAPSPVSAGGLIATKTVTASSTPQKLSFNTGDVSKVEFTFDGTDGSNPYGDGRNVAWYAVSDVTYNQGVVEPAVWSLMIGGFGLAGAALRRRQLRTV